jgi:precorrin-8X/cobalt-precorrin-8 methylmutase
VAAEAERKGTTRSIAAMRKAADDPLNGVFVIGNAPTALFELVRLVREERLRPELVVGLPVGFVGAEESKEALLREIPGYCIPFITNHGRKGGSNVAAAVINALLLLADG